MPADVSQIRRLSASFRAVVPDGARLARLAVRKVCEDTKRDAKILAPVDTGNLRSSIGYETHETKGGAWGEVGPTANYGIFVELGTSRMSGQPFMGPSFDRNAPALEQALGAIGDLK